MDAFLAQLASPATPNPFPSISHLLATVPLLSIRQLVTALLASPVLSNSSPSSPSSLDTLALKEAFKTSIDLKLVALAAQPAQRSFLPSALFSFGPSRTSLFDQWLASLLSSITNANDQGMELARFSMLVGLLEGVRTMEGNKRKLKTTREVEVDVAIVLDELFLVMQSDLRKGKGRSTDGKSSLRPI
jgi:hypothetical protein